MTAAITIIGCIILAIIAYLITYNQHQNMLNKDILEALTHVTKHLELQESINKANTNRFDKLDHHTIWLYDKLGNLAKDKIIQQ